MTRVGVLGVGFLGRLHAQKYADHPAATLTGVYDPDEQRANQVAAEFGTVAYNDLDQLLDHVEAVSIAAPTVHHHALALRTMEAGVHVLLEKPLTYTLEQADELLALQERSGLVLAVGHLKRCHPAVDFVCNRKLGAPLKFSSERFAPFKPRSLDVDVVMDLMVHDLDLALLFIGDTPTHTQAIGASVMTDTTDVAHALITFRNESLASLSASRVSDAPVRRLRLLWSECSAAIDFLEHTCTLYEHSRGEPRIVEEARFPAARVDLLRQQIDAFLTGIEGGPVVCDGREARAALALALLIGEAVSHNRLDN